jgi:hypothetical protein
MQYRSRKVCVRKLLGERRNPCPLLRSVIYMKIEDICRLTNEIWTNFLLKSTIFWDITPCSPFSVNRRFGGPYRRQRRGRKNKLSKKPGLKQVVSLKMEAICSSETSVDTQRTTRRYIPENGDLHNHRCDNFKSYKFSIVSDDFRLLMFLVCILRPNFVLRIFVTNYLTAW